MRIFRPQLRRRLVSLVGLVACAVMIGGLTTAAAESGTGLPNPAGKIKITGQVTAQDGPPASAVPKLSSTYVSIKPCRIVDTRNGGGKLPTGGSREFRVRGTANFPGQGGTSGGCGIPAAATGITANITALFVVGDGSFTTWPVGTSPSNQGFMRVRTNVNAAANPTFTLAEQGTEPSLTIGTSGTSAHIAIDVNGYYIPQIHALISGAGTIYSGSPRVLSAVVNDVGNFTVTLDSDVTYCTPTARPYYPNYYATAAGLSGSTVNVRLWSLSGGTSTPVSTYFYLSVVC